MKKLSDIFGFPQNTGQTGNGAIKTALFSEVKKNYKLGIILFLAIFGVIFVGQVIAVIGSRGILEPVTIQAANKDGSVPASFERFMKLARAGNYTFIRPGGKNNDWTVEGAFIAKILVGISGADLDSVEKVTVQIGNKNFSYNQQEFLQNWSSLDKSVFLGNLTGREGEDYVFFEAPPSLRFSTSRIPLYKSFFSSIINWSGDGQLFIKPLIKSLGLQALAIVLFVLVRIVMLAFRSAKPTEPVSEEQVQQTKRDYVVFTASLFSGLFLLFALILLIRFFYKPDVAAILSQAKADYMIFFFKSIRPKPLERMQFVLTTLFSPFVLLLVYRWWNKVVSKSAQTIANWYGRAVVANIFIVLALAYLGLAVSGFYYIGDSFFAAGWTKYFYAIIIFPLALYLFFKGKFAKKTYWVLEFLALVSIAVAFLMCVQNLYYGLSPSDLDPVIFPMVQVLAGKGLLAPVTSFYGLFPFFLAPVFLILGFSVLKFTLVMAALVAAAFFSVKQALRLIIKDRLIYLLGFLAVVFYTVLATRVMPEYYFQYWPIRFLFPCLGLLLAAIYFRKESKLVYCATFFIFSAGIFWNVDVGVALFVSWLAALFLNNLEKAGGAGRVFVKTFKDIFAGLLALGLMAGIFTLCTRMASGQFPDFSLLLRYQKIFLAGYLNIGMLPPPHMWNIVVLIYLTGLLVTVRALYAGKIFYINKIIFFLSVLGFGLFAYYEGQSSDITLFRVSYPALILLVIFADWLWEKIKSGPLALYGDSIAFVVLIFIFFSIPFSLLINSPKYYSFGVLAIKNIRLRSSPLLEDAAFIKSRTSQGEKVFILAPTEQGVYYAESRTRPVLDIPSVADIAFPNDMQTMVNFLSENSSVKVFVKQPVEGYDIFDQRIKTVLQSRYKQTATDANGLSFYEPK